MPITRINRYGTSDLLVTEESEKNKNATLTGDYFNYSYDVPKFFDSVNALNGIEGIPYQFLPTVDRRISTDNTNKAGKIGRKYTEKIVTRLPLLFLTPCEPLFMAGFSKDDKTTIGQSLVEGAIENINELLEGEGRYYSTEFAYDRYYNYLNMMLNAIAVYLGDIGNEQIELNGKRAKLRNFAWQNEANDAFKTFFSAQENLIFYLDNLSSISESFSNSTTESSLASTINGFSDTSNEIKFLFGGSQGVIQTLMADSANVTSSITSSLSNVLGRLGGGIVKSLSENGVNTVLNGGKIIFPKIWQSSDYSRSYSIEFKFRSPDYDSLSIYLNVLKPYCKLLTLVLPRVMQDENTKVIDPNGYTKPFMVRAYSKGLFNIDYGMITGMSVTKGAQCCWNDDGLPTQIDVTLDIEDLYSNIAMSGYSKAWLNPVDKIKDLRAAVNNTAYMDFLANMAGLNIAQMYMGRKAKMFVYLGGADLNQIPSNMFSSVSNEISKVIGKLYNISSGN